MTEMYNDCPNVSLDSGRYSVLEYFCSAESLRYCYVTSINTNESDYQPQNLKYDIMKNIQNHYPEVIK